jgi:hypothetical protein
VSPTKSEPHEFPSATEYDEWFRAQVQASLDDPRPNVPHEVVVSDARSLIAQRRAVLRARMELLAQEGAAEGSGSDGK